MRDLLPCPFCGGTTIDPGLSDNGAAIVAYCSGCGARGPYKRENDSDEAIAAWNTRTTHPTRDRSE